MNRFLIAAASVVLLAAAPGISPTASAVAVTAPWARATAPQQKEAAVYLQMTSASGDTLQSIDSDDGMAMLHKSVTQGGMSGMEDMDGVPLPAGKTVSLAPGGMHIMLMDIPHPLTAGEKVHLTLHFAKSPAVSVTAPVLPIGARGP
jgi:copper(I)-binding protein